MTNPSPATVPHNKRPEPVSKNSRHDAERRVTRNSRKRLTHRVIDNLTNEQFVKLALLARDPSQAPAVQSSRSRSKAAHPAGKGR